MSEEIGSNKPMGKNQSTFLHWACARGDLCVVRLLIGSKIADPNAVDDLGQTPLMKACKSGHYEIAKFLVMRGCVDLEAMEWSVRNRDLGFVKLFQEHLELLPPETFGATLAELQSASRKDSLSSVKDLVNLRLELGLNPNAVNANGQSTLHVCCQEGHLEIAQFLILEAGADPNATDESGKTPLHYATLSSKLDIVQFLLEHGGSDANIVNDNGQTALHIATDLCNFDIIDLLVRIGNTDVCIVDKDGKTALQRAFQNVFHRNTAEFILSHAKDRSIVDKTDKYGNALVHYAAYRSLSHLSFLVENLGADITIRNTMGKSPLHLASSVGNLEAVQYLVEECHADPYARDKEGLTAIDTADRHEYVVEWLKNVDNNPNTYVLK